jgi:hypothetical protein
MKVFLKCEDANHVCDKTQYKEAGFWEKIKLNIHLIYCTACRKYTARNTKLTKAIKDGHIHSMPKEKKEQMKQELKREILK